MFTDIRTMSKKEYKRQSMKGLGYVLSLLGIGIMFAKTLLADGDGSGGINHLTGLLYIFLGWHMVDFANECESIEHLVHELQEKKGEL